MATPAMLCTGCGKQISGDQVLYTTDARVVCPACSEKAALVGDESRAANNIKRAAWSALISSLVVWVFDPFFLFDILGIVSAIYALGSMRRGNEQFTRYLTDGGRTQIWVCSILGLVILGIHIILILFVFAAIATHPRGL
jgi:uncharacterized membrane protein